MLGESLKPPISHGKDVIVRTARAAQVAAQPYLDHLNPYLRRFKTMIGPQADQAEPRPAGAVIGVALDQLAVPFWIVRFGLGLAIHEVAKNVPAEALIGATAVVFTYANVKGFKAQRDALAHEGFSSTKEGTILYKLTRNADVATWGTILNGYAWGLAKSDLGVMVLSRMSGDISVFLSYELAKDIVGGIVHIWTNNRIEAGKAGPLVKFLEPYVAKMNAMQEQISSIDPENLPLLAPQAHSYQISGFH